MRIEADTPEHYISQLPDDRKQVVNQLLKVIKQNIPQGFQETISYGMIGFVVPHSIYPKGYHVDPKLPLPFLNIASQKNFVAFYHMGLYADKKLMEWFTEEYKETGLPKLDMGKSCLRFTKPERIPYELIGKLAGKLSPEKWIEMYEINFIKNKPTK